MAKKVEYLAPFKSNVLTSWITLFWKANPVIHLKNAHRTRKAHVLLEIRSPFAAYIQLQRIVNWIQDLWPWIYRHFTAFQMLRNWIYLTKVFLPSIRSKGLGNKKVIIAIRGVLWQSFKMIVQISIIEAQRFSIAQSLKESAH